MKKLLTLFATIALTAVCVTPTPLYAADVQTEKTNETVSNAVAEINGTSYASLSEAIQSVQEGQSIKLLQDINLTASIDVKDKTFSLDLNGLNIKQELNDSVGKTNAPIRLYNSSMTVNDSVGTGSIFGYQCAVGVFVNSSLILNNGSLKGEWYGIAGNGLNNNGTTIVINGGSISNADPDGTGAAIYHPQTGEITINGGTVKGDLGIQLCSGNLSVMNINGGTVSGTGADKRNSKTGDGAIPDGAAISVVNRPGYSSIPNVTISGGTFTSSSSEALLAYTWSKNENKEWVVSDWANAKENVRVNGGIFNTDPTAYVSNSYKAFKTSDGFAVAPLASNITLSENELTLEEGASKTVTAVLAPEGTLETVTWSSDKPEIATVKDGKVTALKSGKAVITAETESGKKASCTVTVTKPVAVETPSIDTSKPTDEIKVGVNDEKAEQLLKDVTDQIIAGSSEFTDADTANAVIKAAKAGKTVTVVADVQKADSSNAQVQADAKKIQKELEALTAESNNTATVAMYLDLSVLIKADDTVLGNITNLSTPMEFTVVVPENLLAEGREFYILRVHNGAVNKIVPEHNKNILTFGTDRFSTYAVVYEDKKIDDNGTTPEPKPEPTPEPTPTPEKTIYNVVFVDMNGAVLRTEKVEANKAATAPKAPEVEGYRFVKWDTDFTKVTKDLLVKPVYEKVAATEKPSTPEKPSSDKKSPNTGDTTNAGLFTGFALLGLVSMGIVAIQRKRKQLMK